MSFKILVEINSKRSNEMSKIYEVMKKYGRIMAEQPYPVGEAAKMILQTSEGVFATRDGADMGNLEEEDITQLDMDALPIPKSDVRAVVYSQTPFCQQALREAKPFRACLDDMAQIFGHTAYIVDGRDSNKSMGKSLVKALKNNEGCFVLKGISKDGEGMGYTMTLGRTLYEAVVAMTVIEKSAEVFLLAEKLGGSKPIPKWEAKLMRKKYKKKYSRAEEAVRLVEVE